ncbi:hypothetical protein SB767_29655, partial [Bacillus sp. SIMBA_069]
AAQQAALTKIQAGLAEQAPYAKVAGDGTVTLDFSDPTARSAYVDQLVPVLQTQLEKSNASGGGTDVNDTSFLNSADPRLSKPFLVAFNASAVTVYWVAMI